ncbi:hypothetical protein [Bacillus sp. KH172YL63]|uniref:hypothetical protein n=1 Tax=Bacillus sp. KH172YL63 TaxID=2709784 RepID=UPI0013E4CD15|nr:hypothetical protein [Bacillus sp. KH172YL63]BCB02056.1 hypothetical protein KH172YL63_01890 [Bacillus sp. KH172YL63]
MRKIWLMIVAVLLITSGCTSRQGNVTVKPYKLDEHEGELIRFTGIHDIQFFEINGETGKDTVLVKTIEVYEHGELVRDEPFSSDEGGKHYDDALLSFGNDADNGKVKFIHGMEGGAVTMYEDFEMNGMVYGGLLTEKVALEKDKPLYLYAIAGSDGDEMSGVTVDENGKPDGGILKADKAYVFKIMLTDRSTD